MDFCKKQVKEDCEELLKRFQETGSVRFETFSKIWREMKFSQIFYGTIKSETRAFTQLILNTACRFFLPPFSFQIRVGGLYLMHSLYHTQTTCPREPIRIALKDWEHVKRFEKDAADAQHSDIVYILRRLIVHRAFCFTAMPTLLAFHKKKKMERAAPCDVFVERASRPQELINADLLEELSNIHNLYEKMKTSVCSASEREASSVDVTHKNFISQLRGTVVDFYKWQQKKDGDEDEDGGEGTSSQQECSDRAELLASIKSKAFGQAAEAPKSRRHRQVELDVTSNKAGPSQSSVHPRVLKPSLKARTNMNIRVSADLWRETTATTRISGLTVADAPQERKRLRKTFKWS